MAAAAKQSKPLPDAPHTPVLLRPLLDAVAPVRGDWIDGTFGAGGYTAGLLTAGAETVLGIDRDPSAQATAQAFVAKWGTRFSFALDTFSNLDRAAGKLVDGVVLDLGVSSMQLDQAERGFSFMRDGPLDMRMGADGPSAADLVNTASERTLADILFNYGEERAARRIARAIVAKRADIPIVTTGQLAEIVAGCLPRPKPGQSNPATRSFQAIRIAVNDEYGQLVAGLEAAERALRPGGLLAVVSFHSVEDRIVKRFLLDRADAGGGGSRHAPERAKREPGFKTLGKALGPDQQELAENPRARSAKLRVAQRLDTPARPVGDVNLGFKQIELGKLL